MCDKIEFIYFDLGNVILNFDHQIGCRNVAGLTGITPDQARNYIFDSGLQHEYETGNIEMAEFAARFSEVSGTNPNPKDLSRAISDVFWLNREIIPLLTQLLAIGMPMGILSNTCFVHFDFIIIEFPVISYFFPPENNVLSFQTHSLKPNAQIYADAVTVAGCNAANIFFTDDVLDNVQGAIDHSLQAEPFVNTNRLVKALANRNVLLNL